MKDKTKQEDREGNSRKLRAEAEKKVTRSADKTAPLKKQGLDKLVHELRVHQIELEMQNEELRRTQAELEASQERYFELYDIAPVGYFSISEKGIILEANLTSANMLGVSPRDLRAQRFTSLIFKEDQDIYYLHRRQLFETRAPQVCQIRIVRRDSSLFWARLEATVAQDAKSGKHVCRAVMIDISRQKQAEEELSHSEKFLKSIIEKSPTAMWISDSSGTLIQLNQTCRDLLNITDDEVVGKYNIFKDTIGEEQGVMPLVRDVFEKGMTVKFTLKYDSSQIKNLKLKRKAYVILEVTISAVKDANDEITNAVIQQVDITERIQANEALRVSEAKYRTLFESFPLGITTTDTEGNIVEANKESERLLGLTRDGHLQRKYDGPEWQIVRPDGTPMPPDEYASVRALRENRRIENVEMGIVKGGGEITWINVTAEPIPLEGFGVAITYSDITERKQAEEALQREKRFIESLVDTAQTIILVLDTSGHIVTFNPYMERVSGYKLEEVKGKDWFSTFLPEDNQLKTRDFFLGAISDIQTEGNIDEIVTKDGKTRTIEWCDKTLKDTNGNILGLLSIGQDITERKQTEEALRDSEEKYRVLFMNAGEGIGVTQDGRFKLINPKLVELLGYTEEQILSTSVLEFIYPEDREFVMDRDMRRLKGEIFENVYQFRAVNKSGDTRWVEISTILIEWEGKPATLDYYSDITERKLAEQAILKSKLLLQSVMDSTPDFMYAKDFQHKYLLVNKSFAEAQNIAPQDMIGKADTNFFSEELCLGNPAKGITGFHADDMRAFQGHIVHNPRNLLTWADGSLHIYDTYKIPLTDHSGKIYGVLVYSRDFTERKLAEEALQKSEEQYRLLSEHTTDFVWLMDMNLKPTYQSPSAEKLTGFTHQEIMELPLEKRVTPESLKIAAEVFLHEIPRVESDPDYNPTLKLELEIYRGDGTTLWSENIFSVIRDASGRPISILGEARDITERKLAERRIKESETLYRSLIETSPDAIGLMDLNGTIIMLNKQALEVFGFELTEDLTGKNIMDMVAPENYKEILENMEKLQKAEVLRNLEFTSYKKDGSPFYLELSSSMLFNEEGKPKSIMTVFKDITERREAKNLIEQQREEYRTIFDSVRPMITYLNKDGVIQRINKSGAKTFGLDSEEIVGKTLYDLFPASEADIFTADNAEVLSSGLPKFGLVRQYSIPSGEKRWTRIDRIPYLDEHGDLIGIIAFTQDITRQHVAEEKLRRSLSLVQKTLDDTVYVIAKIVEMKDPFTSGHQVRVTQLANAMAIKMNLPEKQVAHLNTAAIIHDIGKIYVPSDILSKPGKLGDLELRIVQTHAQGSYDILKEIAFNGPIAQIAYQHHERMDGSGYPNGLKGNDILPEARILAVADVVEAMASHRPYRPSLGIEKAVEEITGNRGSKYDEAAVDACLELFNSGQFEFKPV